ncbi:MAG: TetR/AcrR family transcriptional regulator [Candidatus Cloacimonetes bacterium]|nr:TetR/AcrR family transcriptional regulator [Candidatus Cloacimonadota bacterium]
MQVLKDDVRKAILDTAQKLFLEHGYRGCSIRMIATEINMSFSIIYRYFENKEELYKVLVSETYKNFLINSTHFLAEDNNGNYTEENMEFVSNRFAVTLSKIRPQFLLLMSNPDSPVCNDLPELLRSNLTAHILEGSDKTAGFEPLMISLFAGQLLDGIVEVVKNTEDESLLKLRFKQLIRYHFAGLSLFHDRE